MIGLLRRTGWAVSDRIAGLRDGIAGVLRRGWTWQAGIPDEGRIVVVGLLIATPGIAALCAWAGVPVLAALIAPGVVLVATGLGFDLRRGARP